MQKQEEAPLLITRLSADLGWRRFGAYGPSKAGVIAHADGSSEEVRTRPAHAHVILSGTDEGTRTHAGQVLMPVPRRMREFLKNHIIPMKKSRRRRSVEDADTFLCFRWRDYHGNGYAGVRY